MPELNTTTTLSTRTQTAWGFSRFVINRFRQDRCSQVAASLTFTTLLALVPLITIALNFISRFPLFGSFIGKIREFILANFLPESATKIISVYMQQFADNASRLTAVGLIFLAVTAVMLMVTIDRIFNQIWRVARPRPLPRRLMGYATVLIVWPVFIGMSLTLTSYLVSFSLGLAKGLPTASMLLLRVTPVLLTTLAFALLYYKVPNRRVKPRHALLGGLVAAVLFELMKRGFGAYVAHFPSYKLIYGAFSSLPIFLLWMYFSWVVILLGAEITASMQYLAGQAWKSRDNPAQRLYDALRLLRAMMLAHDGGRRYFSPADVQAMVSLGEDRVEALLRELALAGVVRRLPGSRHFEFTRAHETTLADIYRLFLFGQLGTHEAFTPPDDDLAPVMQRMASGVDAKLDQTLAQLFAHNGDVNPPDLNPLQSNPAISNVHEFK